MTNARKHLQLCLVLAIFISLLITPASAQEPEPAAQTFNLFAPVVSYEKTEVRIQLYRMVIGEGRTSTGPNLVTEITQANTGSEGRCFEPLEPSQRLDLPASVCILEADMLVMNNEKLDQQQFWVTQLELNGVTAFYQTARDDNEAELPKVNFEQGLRGNTIFREGETGNPSVVGVLNQNFYNDVQVKSAIGDTLAVKAVREFPGFPVSGSTLSVTPAFHRQPHPNSGGKRLGAECGSALDTSKTYHLFPVQYAITTSSAGITGWVRLLVIYNNAVDQALATCMSQKTGQWVKTPSLKAVVGQETVDELNDKSIGIQATLASLENAQPATVYAITTSNTRVEATIRMVEIALATGATYYALTALTANGAIGGGGLISLAHQ